MNNRKPSALAGRWDRARKLLNIEPPRYMLVDADTGRDMREAQDFEVEHVRRNANFSGVSMLGFCRVTIRKLTGVSCG